MNKVILLGHVGRDPEHKQLPSGSSVANFSLATSETYKNKEGEKVKTTEWHNIVLFGNQADIAAKYVHKGDQILIEGKITTREYTKDDEKKFFTEIKGDRLQFVGKKEDREPEASTSYSAPEAGHSSDLPF